MSWEASLLKSVHLVGEDENDDVYGDFEDEYNPAFDTEGLYEDDGFQQALKSSYGKRVGTSAGRPPGTTTQRMGTSFARGRGGGVPGTSMGGRPMTGVASDPNQARPMTAVRAAGYSSSGGQGPNGVFDPLNQARGPAPPLETKSEDSPLDKIRVLEKQVMGLVEESCFAVERNEHQLALEKAKEAGKIERVLCRNRDQAQLNDQANLDVTYAVLFNLAFSYQNLQMYNEAINTYNVIVKNKMFSNAGRIRVNIGNCYYEQGKYEQAVKYYRMALDQTPQSHIELRVRMMKNVANVFFKQGNYTNALTTYGQIMTELPDVETGFNFLLCAYSLNDKDKMQKAFQKLTQIPMESPEDEKYFADPDDHSAEMLLEAIRDDQLTRYENNRKAIAERCITMATQLIAPVIAETFDDGFDWCTEVVKSSPYVELANDLEITRSIMYLKMKDFSKATETLKKFEKKVSKMQSQAAVNLSFLYFLEGENKQSEKHAEIAMQADHYNHAALLNKGNNEFYNGNYTKAKEFYKEALDVDASCIEAIYNTGLCHKKVGNYAEALESFVKLNIMLPSNAEVLCQIASVYESSDNITEALEWYHQLLNVVPTDPNVLYKIATLYESAKDKSQAFQYMYESFRYYPSSIETITWMGSYYIAAQCLEKATTYFIRAIQVEPLVVKWHLMLATCYRKSGNYAQAMETYKEIHQKFPENLDCVRFLVRLSKDQGLMQEFKEYSTRMDKIQRILAQKEQRAQSGGRRGSGKKQTDSARKSPINAEEDGSYVSPPERVSSSRVRDASKDIDASYHDPLGEAPARPKTSGGRGRPQADVDEFEDEEIGDDLLPD